MNPILLVIIMIGGILILAYQITKNRLLNSLNRALTANDKEAINRITDKSLNQRILSPYVCDLYMLRVLFKTGQIEELKEHLNLVLDKPYTLEKRKIFWTFTIISSYLKTMQSTLKYCWTGLEKPMMQPILNTIQMLTR